MPLAHVLDTLHSTIPNYKDAKTFISLSMDGSFSQYSTYISSLAEIIGVLENQNKLSRNRITSFTMQLPDSINIDYYGTISEKLKKSSVLDSSVILSGKLIPKSIKRELCEKSGSTHTFSINLRDMRFRNLLHETTFSLASQISFDILLRINAIVDDIYNIAFSIKAANTNYVYCIKGSEVKLVKLEYSPHTITEITGSRLGDSFKFYISPSFTEYFKQYNKYGSLINNILTYNGQVAYKILHLETLQIPRLLGSFLRFSHSKQASDYFVGRTPYVHRSEKNPLMQNILSTISVTTVI